MLTVKTVGYLAKQRFNEERSSIQYHNSLLQQILFLMNHENLFCKDPSRAHGACPVCR
jgi:hypothetical protein